MEVWKDIKGYEGFYQISSLGNVKSLKRKRFNKFGFVNEKILKNILSGNKVNKKYYFVSLYKDGSKKRIAVHILMAINFLNHDNIGFKGLLVDHIDNNSLNNNINNLQLITARENTTKDRKGTSKYRGVNFNKEKNKWITNIRFLNKRYHLGYYKIEKKASIRYEEALHLIENHKDILAKYFSERGVVIHFPSKETLEKLID